MCIFSILILDQMIADFDSSAEMLPEPNKPLISQDLDADHSNVSRFVIKHVLYYTCIKATAEGQKPRNEE